MPLDSPKADANFPELREEVGFPLEIGLRDTEITQKRPESAVHYDSRDLHSRIPRRRTSSEERIPVVDVENLQPRMSSVERLGQAKIRQRTQSLRQPIIFEHSVPAQVTRKPRISTETERIGRIRRDRLQLRSGYCLLMLDRSLFILFSMLVCVACLDHRLKEPIESEQHDGMSVLEERIRSIKRIEEIKKARRAEKGSLRAHENANGEVTTVKRI